jgi:hypothetical protein
MPQQSELFIAPGQGASEIQPPTPSAASYVRLRTVPEQSEFAPENLETGVKKRSLEELGKFMTLARERFRVSSEYWQEQRQLAAEDMRFRVADQWPIDIKTQRELEKRPCLTINRIPQFIRQVTNDERQNRPSIHVTAKGENASTKTADIIEGLIRSIESENADVAYDTAFDYAASTGGPGWIRVLNDYEDYNTFKQKLKIKRVLDPNSVYVDPYFQEPDGSDIQWAFVVEDYSPEEYKAAFGDYTEVEGLAEFYSPGDDMAEWTSEKNIRVAEYYQIIEEDRVLLQLSNGEEKFEDEVSEADRELAIRKRTVSYPKVHWTKINAKNILEERSDHKGRYIPLVPVLGEELIVDGKRSLSGVIRYAKDPQRAYNYWTSAQTEMIALAPKSPFLIAVGQLKGVEDFWKDLNTKNRAYLPYKETSVDGHMVPVPTRLSSEPPIQATAVSRAQAADDLKATTGLYDASVGAKSNETSGRAILARQHEGDVANFHLIDNLTRSIRHVGRICVDLIPYVYDTPRVERIIGIDQKEKQVRIQSSLNPNVPAVQGDQQQISDAERIYDVGVGKYDVTVVVGPSYSTRRQEAAISMVELTRNFPIFAQVAGDLMVQAMDWPNADKIAERLHKMLPPELQEADDDNKIPVPPQVQAQMKQLMQQHEQLTALVNKLLDEREKNTLELASKERINDQDNRVKLIIEQAKIEKERGIALLQAEVATIGKRLDVLSKIEAQKGMAPESEAGPEASAQPESGGATAL